MQRVVVFIDAQNFYRGARRAFFSPTDPSALGQFQPRRLGSLLTTRDPDRRLLDVRLYTGRPDGYQQPKAHAANVRQCQAWDRAGCYVFHRPLRYPFGWPDNPRGRGPEEKGIDVEIALDIVGADYDVAILCSADTDLLPPVERVIHDESNRIVEVAGWRHPNYRQRLSSDAHNLWCHWLQQGDYETVRAETDYTLA